VVRETAGNQRERENSGRMNMLVLSRKAGEAIAIDGGIKVTVIAVHGKTVKIGVEAPDDVLISRMELLIDSEALSAQDCEINPVEVIARKIHREGPSKSRHTGGGCHMRAAMILR
jgi:carbon storage regulator CsrA